MDAQQLRKVFPMVKKYYREDMSDTKIWKKLREEGIRISRPKVSQLRRRIGPPKHRPYGPERGLTDEQFEWWSMQKDRTLLMRYMVAFLMTLTPGHLELFKYGRLSKDRLV